jgi:hypothetical protein
MATTFNRTTFNAAINAAVAAITADGGRVEIHLDVESNGLRGIGFAIGGFVRQGEQELMEFAMLAPLPEGQEMDGWVKENILPHLGDLPRAGSIEDMYSAYGALYFAVKNRILELHGLQPWDAADLRRLFAVVYDNGMPVEAAFEARCWEHLIAVAEAAGEDAFGVIFGGAYMPIDISTALDVLGYDPDLNRAEAAEVLGVTGLKHNPIDDARQSAAVYDAARAGTLPEKYRA